jgi:phosphate uptake regulator
VVFQFFKGSDSGLEEVGRQVAGMIADGRHSFDVAMSALITDADITPLGEEVRGTDHRINRAEENVRRALVVHSAVHGGIDVGVELAYLLMVKKLERVGDQSKNLFDLAAEGVRFSKADDYEGFVAFRDEISRMFGEAGDILATDDHAAARDFLGRADTLMDTFDQGVNGLIHSDAPAHYAVPRALLYRYLKRIVANLAGVVQTLVQPIDRHRTEPDIDE